MYRWSWSPVCPGDQCGPGDHCGHGGQSVLVTNVVLVARPVLVTRTGLVTRPVHCGESAKPRYQGMANCMLIWGAECMLYCEGSP